MPVDREEEQGREDRQELAERRSRWPLAGSTIAGEAEAHRVADHLARDHRRGKADLHREADREADHHLAGDEHEARDRDERARAA